MRVKEGEGAAFCEILQKTPLWVGYSPEREPAGFTGFQGKQAGATLHSSTCTKRTKDVYEKALMFIIKENDKKLRIHVCVLVKSDTVRLICSLL